jgi:SAM-dependent methyltransferase
MDHPTILLARIRRLVAPLRSTPLHPQWFIARAEARIRRRLAAACSGLVVDVGCASMAVADYLPASRCRYVGLDYPPTVRTMYRTRPHVFADAHALPLADGSADAVLLLNVLEHLRAPARAIAEAARVLAPGGSLFIDVPFLYPLHDRPHDFQRWTEHGLREALDHAGLDAVEIEAVGQPTETAALLANLALAAGLAAALQRRSALALLLGAFMLLVPVINVLGASGRILIRGDAMPHGYFAIARRKAR